MNLDAGCKRPVSVLVVVHVAGHRFLLLERTEPAGYWQSVTGSLEWDEDPEAAARRELREETGLDPAQGRLIATGQVNHFAIHPAWRHRFAPEVRYNREHVFEFLLPHEVAICTTPAEHAAWGWFDLDAAIERTASYTNRDALHAIARRFR